MELVRSMGGKKALSDWANCCCSVRDQDSMPCFTCPAHVSGVRTTRRAPAAVSRVRRARRSTEELCWVTRDCALSLATMPLTVGMRTAQAAAISLSESGVSGARPGGGALGVGETRRL